MELDLDWSDIIRSISGVHLSWIQDHKASIRCESEDAGAADECFSQPTNYQCNINNIRRYGNCTAQENKNGSARRTRKVTAVRKVKAVMIRMADDHA